MGRILAVDYGMRRTGLAVSDPLKIIAGALETVDTRNLEQYIRNYCQVNDVETIVIGLPKQTSGLPSDTMPYVEKLADRLRTLYPEKQIVLYDERYTSVLAQRTIRESGMGRMARRDKALVDKVAATIILQSYMDSKDALK